jgi:signal transduction histidine kinase
MSRRRHDLVEQVPATSRHSARGSMRTKEAHEDPLTPGRHEDSPGRRRPASIAKRLFVSAALLSLGILVTAGIALSTIYRHTAEASFDERLNAYLHGLVADIATGGEDSRALLGQLGEPQFELPFSGWYWQVTRLDQPESAIKSSRSLFAARLPHLSDAGVPAGPGGARRGYVKGPDDQILRMVERIIDTGDQGIYLVQVAATTGELDSQIARFELDLVITFAALGAALVISAAAQLRFGLKPLRKLQEGVAAIRRGEAEKIEGDFPQDLKPLASELNLLIAANREVVERARTQVGNLAHALKTPLSVIVNEASPEGGPLAAKVLEQAAIMRDQVSYYLHRARAAVSARTPGSSAEVTPVIEALVRTFEKIYVERGVRFTVFMPSNLRFQGERQDLEEMTGNLIDNAGKWAHGEVAIQVTAEPWSSVSERGFFRVIVDDDGPGLPSGLRQAALSRGKRLDETKPGSGLGLSIVADLASAYDGELTLEDSPKGGLRARLRLPLA